MFRKRHVSLQRNCFPWRQRRRRSNEEEEEEVRSKNEGEKEAFSCIPVTPAAY